MCRGRLLTTCVGLLLSLHYNGLSVATEPGFLDFDNLPETNFSCEGKVIGGYYADTETGCQMFHVCTIGQKGEVTDIKFLCLNGTVFDQETRVCERLDEVDCSKSESFYGLNLELYGNNAAGYGIQPENEDIQNDEACQEEDEEDCKTDTPPSISPAEPAQASSDESEGGETTTQQSLTSSTTARGPPGVTSISYPSTTPSPQILQFPSTSPESLAALLALHKAFTQSLQQHSANKDAKINPPKLTGFVGTLDPIKSTPHTETFEISAPAPPEAPPRPTSHFPQSKLHTQFSIPQKTLFQNPPKLQFQSPPPPPPSLKQQFSSQTNPQFQNNQQTQYQLRPNLPPPLPLPPVNQPKPIQTTSERYGNVGFHHSFHINSQAGHFPDPNYDEEHYSDDDAQSSPQPKTEAPKQYDFDYEEEDYYDEKPPSSTITPYQLHQLKVNQLKGINPAKAKAPSSGHNSFVREVASPTPTKAFNIPTFRSVTPSIAIITTTSTTSSSSVKTSKPVPSAILTHKEPPSGAGFLLSPTSNTSFRHQFSEPPQSYDDYREGDVRSDPFYKDVPKIGRNKRNIQNGLFRDSTVTFLDYGSLIKLKDNLLNSVLKNNSHTVLRAILKQYCNDKNSSSIISDTYCLLVRNSNFSDTELGENWKIVVPKSDSDYLYLSKTIFTANESENSTSNILILVHFPEEFKIIRDSILRHFENRNTFNSLNLNSVNSSTHHRFKRVKRNKHLGKSFSIIPSKTNKSQKKTRKKRQSGSAETEESVHVIKDSRRVVSRPRNRASQVVVRRRPIEGGDTPSISEEPRPRPRKRLPSRNQTRIETVTQIPRQDSIEEAKPLVPSNEKIPPNEENAQDKRLGRPTSRRRGQGVRYHFSEGPPPPQQGDDTNTSIQDETSTVYPFNLKPGTQFSCDDKIKGGYYADVEAQCYGYFICSQGEINGPLLKSHFWCGPTTKFNQRSRTCQVEANVACAVSQRYFHLNKDILSLPDPDIDVKDTFEPAKVKT